VAGARGRRVTSYDREKKSLLFVGGNKRTDWKGGDIRGKPTLGEKENKKMLCGDGGGARDREVQNGPRKAKSSQQDGPTARPRLRKKTTADGQTAGKPSAGIRLKRNQKKIANQEGRTTRGAISKDNHTLGRRTHRQKDKRRVRVVTLKKVTEIGGNIYEQRGHNEKKGGGGQTRRRTGLEKNPVQRRV